MIARQQLLKKSCSGDLAFGHFTEQFVFDYKVSCELLTGHSAMKMNDNHSQNQTNGCLCSFIIPVLSEGRNQRIDDWFVGTPPPGRWTLWSTMHRWTFPSLASESLHKTAHFQRPYVRLGQMQQLLILIFKFRTSELEAPGPGPAEAEPRLGGAKSSKVVSNESCSSFLFEIRINFSKAKAGGIKTDYATCFPLNYALSLQKSLRTLLTQMPRFPYDIPSHDRISFLRSTFFHYWAII